MCHQEVLTASSSIQQASTRCAVFSVLPFSSSSSAMRISEKGPRIVDGKRGPDQTFKEARIRLRDWPGSDARKVRIRSQRGARIRRTRGLSSVGFWNVVRDMDQVGYWNGRATGPGRCWGGGRSWEALGGGRGGFGKSREACKVLGRPWETLGDPGKVWKVQL